MFVQNVQPVVLVRRRKGLRGLGVPVVTITPGGARIITDSGVPAAPATYGDGTLLGDSTTGHVFVVRGGVLEHIPDPATFDADGFKWSDIVQVSESVINAMPKAPYQSLPMAQPIAATQQSTGIYFDGQVWRNSDGTPRYAAQTSMVPNTVAASTAVPVASTISSGISSLTSALPSWWPYAAIAGVGWFLFANKKGRR